MVGRHTRTVVLLLVGCVIGALAAGIATGARYDTADGTRITSIKLTGGGLPDLHPHGTVGVAEFPDAIREYHDSGLYDQELAQVDALAKRSLKNQLRRLREADGPGRYSECNRRGKKCHEVKPAMVLDIDETSLSNYEGLNSSNFSQVGLVPGAVAGDDPAIQPTLDLYHWARARGVEVFFITGRPDIVREPTERNLEEVGYDQGFAVTTKPSGPTTIEYKSGERARLEQEGYTILINVGDQDSDLAGGHARRSFKLPNPMYFIP